MVAIRKSVKPIKNISAYEIYARYIPALLTGLPFIIGGFLLMKAAETKDILDFLLSLRFFGYISFTFIGLYFYAQLIRTVSKSFEKRYFHDQNGFPSTYFMLYANREYSDALKDAYRDKVKQEFNFLLSTRSEEEASRSEAIKRLNDITKRVILRVGKGVLIDKHNQWYGFFRNLIGGSIFGLLGSLSNLIVGYYILHDRGIVLISALLFVGYCALLLFRRPLIMQHAEAYARQLHAEFMNTSRPRRNNKESK